MKRLDLVVASSLAALALFVGAQAVSARQSEQSRRERKDGHVTIRTSDGVTTARGSVRRHRDDDPNAEDVRRRIELSATSTYISDLLAAHDSSLARWPERRVDPLRVWIQPVARYRGWSPASLTLVREAFLEWGESGVPVNFTFVLDSASANVHVLWVDRFREPISGKTLWTHDDRWLILRAEVMIAVHHHSGDALDRAATKAIALHEVGHLLGLDHTDDSTSIMAPRVRVKELSAADRATAQLLYSLPPGRIGGMRRSAD